MRATAGRPTTPRREATISIIRPFDATSRDRDRGLFTLRSFTLMGAIASVAFCGWVMSQAAAASRAAALIPTATPAALPTPTPVLGALTPEQLAALEFSLPKIAAQPATPLRPAPAPRRVAAPAQAAAPAAKTGTS